MPSDSGFRVYPNPQSKLQLRELYMRARETRAEGELVAVWNTIFTKLESDPETFGEPRHRTKLAGGMVYQGMFNHCVVTYAVYKDQSLVYVLDVNLLSEFFKS